MSKKKRSLLEDDALAAIVSNEDESSDDDVCECGCPRRAHGAGGCECGKCDGFKEEEP